MEALTRPPSTAAARYDKAMAADVDEPGVRAFSLQSLDLKSDPPRWRLNLRRCAIRCP